MTETLVRSLFADVQGGADFRPGCALLTAHQHHFGDPLCHCYFQCVETAENLKFTDASIDWCALGNVEFESSNRFCG